MKLQNFHVEIADWSRASDRNALAHIRLEVFVEELGVPGLLESDEFDADAFHLLARDDAGHAIGTARMTSQHRISRLAVVAAWRGQGVGIALLRQLVDRARSLGWPEIRLDAQIDAVGFYAREGFASTGELFEDGGLLHQSMVRALRPDAVPAPPLRDSGPLDASHRGAVEHARLQLLASTRHDLAIYVPVLATTMYSSPSESAELRRIATSGRGARIRILLQDAAAAARDGHRLLALAQRLPSVLQIRRPIDEVDLAYRSAYLLNDTGGYLFLPDSEQAQGRAAVADAAAQIPLRQHFDNVWARSARATELSPLDI
jgi:predicted GNAT family N-acyltransferase